MLPFLPFPFQNLSSPVHFSPCSVYFKLSTLLPFSASPPSPFPFKSHKLLSSCSFTSLYFSFPNVHSATYFIFSSAQFPYFPFPRSTDGASLSFSFRVFHNPLTIFPALDTQAIKYHSAPFHLCAAGILNKRLSYCTLWTLLTSIFKGHMKNIRVFRFFFLRFMMYKLCKRITRAIQQPMQIQGTRKRGHKRCVVKGRFVYDYGVLCDDVTLGHVLLFCGYTLLYSVTLSGARNVPSEETWT